MVKCYKVWQRRKEDRSGQLWDTKTKVRVLENLINNGDDINSIDETLREPLLHIANKLLGRQNLNFDQLTPPEQKLWNRFENSDIYEFSK